MIAVSWMQVLLHHIVQVLDFMAQACVAEIRNKCCSASFVVCLLFKNLKKIVLMESLQVQIQVKTLFEHHDHKEYLVVYTQSIVDPHNTIAYLPFLFSDTIHRCNATSFEKPDGHDSKLLKC